VALSNPPPWEWGLEFLCFLLFSLSPLCFAIHFGGVRVWTQSFTFAKQAFYCLNQTSTPFLSGYFGDGISKTICQGWLWATIRPSNLEYRCKLRSPACHTLLAILSPLWFPLLWLFSLWNIVFLFLP
jgi:hypothetical protein